MTEGFEILCAALLFVCGVALLGACALVWANAVTAMMRVRINRTQIETDEAVMRESIEAIDKAAEQRARYVDAPPDLDFDDQAIREAILAERRAKVTSNGHVEHFAEPDEFQRDPDFGSAEYK